jgi:hypothetical protein
MEGMSAWAKKQSGGPVKAGPVMTGLESPQTKMAFAFNLRGMQVYGGTVPAETVRRNRARNKAAHKARMMHRKASK